VQRCSRQRRARKERPCLAWQHACEREVRCSAAERGAVDVRQRVLQANGGKMRPRASACVAPCASRAYRKTCACAQNVRTGGYAPQYAIRSLLI